MKKNKVWVILIILLILIFTTIIVMKNINKNDINNEHNFNTIQDKSEVKYKKNESESMYFTIKECLDKYLNEIKKKDAKSVFKILDSKYIEEKGITEKNVFDNIKVFKDSEELKIKDILIEEIDGINDYYVYSELREKENDNNNRKKYYYTIKINLDDNTFSVMPNVPKGVFDEN